MTIRIFAIIAVLSLSWINMDAETVPFQLIRKSIIIEATVNEVTGYFILDSGTPYLILNQKHFKGRPTGKKMVGLVGKSIDIYETEVQLTVKNLKWNRLQATLLSLDHLSHHKGIPILGLIGTSVINRMELTIDFDALQLELKKVSKKSASTARDHLPDASFKFSWRGGIPVIKTTIGGEAIVFGFDTGAGINVLDRQKEEQLIDYLMMNNRVNVSGMGKGKQSMKSGIIQNVTIENFYCPEMKIVLTSMSRFKGFGSQLNGIDGFLGYEFLKHFKTVINFKKGTIKLYHRDRSARNYIVAR